MLYFDSKAITDVGNKRTINQDNYLNIVTCVNNKYIGVFCVADGMGGLQDGEYASQFAVSETQQWYEKNLAFLVNEKLNENKLIDELKKLFYSINTEIYNYGLLKNSKVGTTYSLLLVIDNKYFVVHAGDSRIYLKRNNDLFLLTKDQTWVNEQLEQGLISLEEAKNHPRKNVLSNCLGCFENPSVCVGNGEIFEDDCFLLCSDGLYNLVTTGEISIGMSDNNFIDIPNMFLRLVKQRGAFDNVTMIIIAITNAMKETITVEI